jgi:hypothetical protein
MNTPTNEIMKKIYIKIMLSIAGLMDGVIMLAIS